jgi:hypothetical protein
VQEWERCVKHYKGEGLLERKEEGRGASNKEREILIPVKAAIGLCARLSQYGGRGFLMRACRSIVYSFKKYKSFKIFNL